MKYLLGTIALLSNLVYADGCLVTDAKVTSVLRYQDGNIIVTFDKATDCGCSQTNRLGFGENAAGMDFVKSMILVSYITQSPVNAWATDNSCSIHGNTAVLTSLQLMPK